MAVVFKQNPARRWRRAAKKGRAPYKKRSGASRAKQGAE